MGIGNNIMNNELYTNKLRAFCEKFEDGINLIDKRDGTKTGFVFIFVRDNHPDSVDLASNLTNDTIIEICLYQIS